MRSRHVFLWILRAELKPIGNTYTVSLTQSIMAIESMASTHVYLLDIDLYSLRYVNAYADLPVESPGGKLNTWLWHERPIYYSIYRTKHQIITYIIHWNGFVVNNIESWKSIHIDSFIKVCNRTTLPQWHRISHFQW